MDLIVISGQSVEQPPRIVEQLWEPLYDIVQARTSTGSRGKVDELVKALGLDGGIDIRGVADLQRARPVGRGISHAAAPRRASYVWVDATDHKVRVDGRVTSQATVVAIGVTTKGERQVLGIDLGPSENRAFWTAGQPCNVRRAFTQHY
jgi:putative transposase